MYISAAAAECTVHHPMPNDALIPTGRQLVRAGKPAVPTLFADAGERATRRVLEFFTAQIRNPNTRAAYARAVQHFAEWCERSGVTLEQVEPIVVAAYVEQLGHEHSKPTVKQYLAAIRMLFDWLVLGQV